MPTYNEAESLSFSISSVRELELDLDVLIVDDNSPDGTGQLADNLSNSKTFVLHRKIPRMVLVLPTLLVLIGLLQEATRLSLRWMPMEAIRPRIL
jgi:glycosyltransferase involved in cell wall biosynthesis